jgi:ATP-binding protein involved in chromosome partitioning
LGIVENMAYFTPEDLPDRKYYIFGEGGGQTLASEYNVPLLASLPMTEKIREGSDEGYPPALDEGSVMGKAFHDLGVATAQQIAIRNQERKQEAAVS